MTLTPWIIAAGATVIALIYRGEAIRWRRVAEFAKRSLDEAVARRRDARGRFVSPTKKEPS